MRMRSLPVFILSLLTLLTFSLKVNADTDALDIDLESENGCVASVSLSKAIKSSSFVAALRRGYWLCSKAIVTSSQLVDYKGAFDIEQRILLKEIKDLKSAIDSSLPMTSIKCPFKWAQSPTEILLSVKFSHKIDAPATLNVVANNVTVLDNRLMLSASDGRKNFNLDIEFMHGVIPSESTWSMASVGRMTFNIKKSEAPIKWAGLTKGNKKLHQMHYWWEIQEKFSEELDKLDEASKLSKEPPVPTDSAKENVVVEKEDPLKKIQTAAADAEFDQDAGKIVSAEDLAIKAEGKRVEDEYKTKVAALGDEARKRKKEIDSKAKSEKESIDLEIASRKLELDSEREQISSKGTDEL